MAFDIPIAFDCRDWPLKEEDEFVSFLYNRLREEDPEAEDLDDIVQEAFFDAVDFLQSMDKNTPNKEIRSAKEVVFKLIHLRDKYIRYVAYADSIIQHLGEILRLIFAGKPFKTHIGTDQETHEERCFRVFGLRSHNELHNLFSEGGCMYELDFGMLVATADINVDRKYLAEAGKRRRTL